MRSRALLPALLGLTLGLTAPAWAQSGPPGKGLEGMKKVKGKAKAGLDDLEREARQDLEAFEREAKKKADDEARGAGKEDGKAAAARKGAGEARKGAGEARKEAGEARKEAGEARGKAAEARARAEAARGRAGAARDEAGQARDARGGDGVRGRADRGSRPQQRAEAQARWRKVLGDRPASPELVQRERRHAERLARLDRIEGIAIEKGDEETLARLRALRDKQEARHQAWLERKAAQPEGKAEATPENGTPADEGGEGDDDEAHTGAGKDTP